MSKIKNIIQLLLLCHAPQESPFAASEERFLKGLMLSAIQTWSTCFIRCFFEEAAVIACLSMRLKYIFTSTGTCFTL